MQQELDLKFVGMELAERAASEDWKTRAKEIIEKFARGGYYFDTFTANDVRGILEHEGFDLDHRCAMGSLFTTAARSGLIVGVGFTKNTIAGGHAGHLRIWKGC